MLGLVGFFFKLEACVLAQSLTLASCSRRWRANADATRERQGQDGVAGAIKKRAATLVRGNHPIPPPLAALQLRLSSRSSSHSVSQLNCRERSNGTDDGGGAAPTDGAGARGVRHLRPRHPHPHLAKVRTLAHLVRFLVDRSLISS